MARKKKINKSIDLFEHKGKFKTVKRGKKHDSTGIASLKRLLTDEKARILHVIKKENPSSVYELAKKLGRNFKNVDIDLKLLEKLGIIKIYKEKTGKRVAHVPKIVPDSFSINIKI